MIGNGTFDNQGNFVHTSSDGTSIEATFNNSGFVDVQDGTLYLRGGGTHTGDFDATGKRLYFQTGNHVLSGSQVIGDLVSFGNTGSSFLRVGSSNLLPSFDEFLARRAGI